MNKYKFITRFHQFIRAAVLPRPKLQTTLVKSEQLNETQAELVQAFNVAQGWECETKCAAQALRNVFVAAVCTQYEILINEQVKNALLDQHEGKPVSVEEVRKKLDQLRQLALEVLT